MGKPNGLNAFLRKEWARKQAGVGSMVSKPVHIVEGCATGIPYKLPPEQTKMLEGMATKECFRCKGTGITKWKQAGRMAIVCRCVQQKLPAMQAKLEEEQKRLAAQVAEEKAKLEPKEVKPEPPTLSEVGSEAPMVNQGTWAQLKSIFGIGKKEPAMCPHARPVGTPCPHCLGIGEGAK